MTALGGWLTSLLVGAFGIVALGAPVRTPLHTVAHVQTQAGCSVDPSVQAQPGIVFTDHGAVQGVREGNTYAFKGIPYAAAPVGPLRFRPPGDAACWSGARDASAFGNVCPQSSNGSVIGDEDCLSLNVWMPDAAQGQGGPLPVMFFIHGGGNANGSSAQPLYDGGPLAERESAVVVTINYRLGALGFLAHPALDAESATGTSGNYGILDQIAALGWVQRNAPAFGGDTSRVLIFGESAGGVDVCTLIASPLAAGLFSRALIESGGCANPTLATEERTGSRYVTAAGCDGADVASCLRGLSAAATVMTLGQDVSVVDPRTNLWHPNVDGYALTGSPLDVIRAGNHNHVPIVVGSNADETGAYVPASVRTEADYQQAVTQIVGARAGDRILAEYPASAFASPRQAFVAVTTDAFFVCPSRTYARAVATGQQEPVYRYFFTHRAGGSTALLGAFHALELFYVFGTPVSLPGYTPTAADRAVSAAIMDYWGSFAATGVPSGPIAWPQYDPATDPYLQIDDPVSAGAGVRTDCCDFWDGLVSGQ